ncbi:cupin-like domain-containing protein [Sphingomonas sp. LR60]|uniref:cupin-like domain-containing protein n=1 Tax=Sphingomonas sp. LR60 TaxID=3050233 RepID=UPI002FE0974F
MPGQHVTERDAVDAATFANEVASGYAPVVLRGQVRHWAAVRAGAGGDRAIAAYLAGFGGGQPLDVMIGAPEIGGRFFYNHDLTGFNFHRQKVALGQLLGQLLSYATDDVAAPHALYANAATAPDHLPGWEADNALDLPTGNAPARLWIGNATRVATHYDQSNNIACVVHGRRRFTLFPPDQLANLYIGPLDNTLAGPPSSMVDPDAPDLARYPRFSAALAHAQVAELEPGDAIFIPAIWWHHVAALDRLNVLVNYWWTHEETASPFGALVHALMAIRDLPPAPRAAWRTWFDHYVFDDDAANAGAHLPEAARGILSAGSPARTERLRGFLIRLLGGRV